MRQIVLDTETTGLETSQDHRIIEIGCVELINRRPTGNSFHHYLQPDREIDAGAMQVHGITNESLADKPRFNDIAKEFLDYIRGAELVIHNAPFDVGFLNHELAKLDGENGVIEDICSVLDTLVMARNMHPGQKNSLDALCKRYEIDNTSRTLHGALLDAEILADVYLAMTGGQVSLSLGGDSGEGGQGGQGGQGGGRIRRLPTDRIPLPVIQASDEEMGEHQTRLEAIDKASDGNCVWLHDTRVQ